MKTFVVSSSCWKILLFLSIHRDQITNSTSVCSPFICWFESIVNWVNQACKSWSAVQLVGEREGQVAHADTKVQTYLEYEHSATKWKAVSKTRRFLLHSWKPTLFFLWKESQHDVSYSCHMASDSETFAGTNGPKAVEHERGIYRNCWYFTSMGPSQDYFEKKIAMSPMRTAVSRERKAVVVSAGGIYFGI